MKRINQIEPVITKKDKIAISQYLKTNGWITENKVTTKFEQKFAKIVNSKYSVAYPNGTLTILSILLALGVKKVMKCSSNYTMVATANAIILAGAKPILCDISNQNLCLDVNKVIKKINKKTKAIIYVTLNGRSGNLDKIQNL